MGKDSACIELWFRSGWDTNRQAMVFSVFCLYLIFESNFDLVPIWAKIIEMTFDLVKKVSQSFSKVHSYLKHFP